MFAGLMGIERGSARHRCEITEGGRVSGTAGSSARRRLHRRLGSTRAEAAQLHTAAPDQEEEEHDAGRTVRSKSRTEVGVGEVKAAAAKLSGMTQQEPDGLMSGSPSLCWSDSVPLPPCGRWVGRDPAPMNEVKVSPASAVRCSAKETFSSSFSFIQQSLNSSQTAETPPSQDPEPLIHKKGPNSPKSKGPVQLLPSASSGDPTDSEDLPSCRRFWLRCPWDRRGDPPDPPDCDAVDIEIISSFSVDSDNASASSVTSGYESATPTSDQGWDNLVKKYEGVLQDCLQNNRTYTKIESMMLKLQRLQQKAILDDDYDAAERFGKKLEQLRGERGGLSLGLPSTQPSVALFLQRLRHAVHSALQRPDWGHCRDVLDVAEQRDASPGPLQRRDKLVRERRLVEEDIAQLQRRLAELTERSRCLQQQIQHEEHHVEAEELESCVRRSCTTAQLRGLSQSLQDLVSCESRRQISASPPVAMLSLQEQEQALNLSIKEATAKVVMSQRLGSSLRRKVSETETQLLALQEAKLAAISGNDFSSAKELKAEMKGVHQERERLEALATRLQSLSSGSSQELEQMKEQRQQLREELEHQEAQHESRLKENATKYVKLLEDRLHSCVCPGLDRIWEADLGACQLLLRGLQVWTPSCSGADMEEVHFTKGSLMSEPPTKEEDCAMLTALGGRWGPEANLQNSEFAKKLEEFLFGMEENHNEDACGDAEAAALTEHCELIGHRLTTLEDELHTALLTQDHTLTQSLEEEVQAVKATLQTMLSQLEEEEEEEEEELQDDDLMMNRSEEEEDEDQYFSDSWDI
uniref:Disrupted in schizophrenia 1 protein n=1 Tax=Takifugu rubripes TaxID=31033 RepID=Q8AXT1_TAKRU|nr:disrupted in schizophrenia 1 protein [Takifugu rubripes]